MGRERSECVCSGEREVSAGDGAHVRRGSAGRRGPVETVAEEVML